MVTFIILAAVLVAAAGAAIAVPLLRHNGKGTQSRWTALAVAGVLVVGTTAIYVSLSNWSWSKAAASASSPQAMVGRLARRLMKNPDDLQGWLMLGRSYTVIDQTQLAARAYERANQLAGGRNADALIGLAEALTVEDESNLSGRAGKLIEKALLLDPHSPKALFFGAAAAVHRGDLPLARQRFSALLALDPPQQVKSLIEQQIAAIDQRLAGGASGAGAQAPGSGRVAAATPAQGPAIHVKVALSPKLKLADSSGAPLFVFVRDPKQPGPPLAVKRLETRFPQTVELTAADAMIPGRAITAGEDVQVVARIAKSGSPIAQKGDPFGETAYHVDSDGIVNVTIDRLTP